MLLVLCKQRVQCNTCFAEPAVASAAWSGSSRNTLSAALLLAHPISSSGSALETHRHLSLFSCRLVTAEADAWLSRSEGVESQAASSTLTAAVTSPQLKEHS
jgi:hypothetical protein